MKNAEQFSGKAGVYAKSRPGYPAGLLDCLCAHAQLGPHVPVADIGAGTGIFSRLLLERGCTVYAVEPNSDMRQEWLCTCGGLPGGRLFIGSAEHTGLKSRSVACAAAAQAFHWFDAAAFQAECRRILRPGGQVALIWNQRSDCELSRESALLFARHCPRFSGFSGGRASSAGSVEAFFAEAPKAFFFDNPALLTKEQFLGRCLSASYSLAPGQTGFAPYVHALRSLFERYASDGLLLFPQQAVLYLGTLQKL